jgi:hypothetical protein
MTIVNSTVSVGATAVQLVDGTTLRKAVIIQNVHATQILFIGGDANVTTANGLRIGVNESVQIDRPDPVYGIASGAATDVRVFEIT